jgi:O-antigen/teichoic acid export membrane protein
VTGQLLPVAVTPVLTRLYSPDDFGVFAVFFSIVVVLGAVAGLRLEQAIVVERTDNEAAATMMTALIVAMVLMTAILIVGYVVAPAFVADASLWQSLSFWLSIMLASLALCSMNTLTLAALRAQEMIAPGRAKLVQGVVQAVVPVAAGWTGAGSSGLIVGQTVGFMAGAAGLLPIGLRLWKAATTISPHAIMAAWQRQRPYRVYAAPALLLNIGSKMLPVVILAAFWGPAVAGQVGVAQRLLSAPARLIGQTISQFYIARAAPLARTDLAGLQRLFLKHVAVLSAAGGLLFAPVLAVSPDLVAVALGDEWRPLSHILKLLVPLAWADFVLFPVGQTFNLINRHKAGLVVDVLQSVALLMAFLIIFIQQGDAETVVLVWSLVTFVCYSLGGLYIYVCLKSADQDQLLNG